MSSSGVASATRTYLKRAAPHPKVDSTGVDEEDHVEWDSLYDQMGETNREAVKAVGGEYILQKNEKNWAIRLARNSFLV